MRRLHALGIASLQIACLTMSARVAAAQNAGDFINFFGGLVQHAIAETTRVEWRKLPDGERICIERSLNTRGTNIRALIQRGIKPTDGRLVSIRASCRGQFAQPPQSEMEAQPSKYVVEGLALGARVNFGSNVYRLYRCSPSEQFDGFTWCSRTRQDQERRGAFAVSYSILHAQDGTVVYVNREQQPAYWALNEVADDIARYARAVGEQPRIMTMPGTAGLPNGTLAIWGGVVLEPLDSGSRSILASGRSPKKGILVDYIGDLVRSAREGLPVYHVGGGPGFVWVASHNGGGTGTLRFFAVNAASYSAPVPLPESPSAAIVRPPALESSIFQGLVEPPVNTRESEAERLRAEQAKRVADQQAAERTRLLTEARDHGFDTVEDYARYKQEQEDLARWHQEEAARLKGSGIRLNPR